MLQILKTRAVFSTWIKSQSLGVNMGRGDLDVLDLDVPWGRV